ncbi:MAG: hypothetical protein AAGN35_28335 [Bacteroidota bacterium]
MQVHQYIYTRLSKRYSPWDKAGFQSAFLPLELIDQSEAIDLESYIHRPEGDAVSSKHVVFWQEIKGRTYQVLYFLDALPEETDEYGRGGIFMCQGFLIPPELWRRYRRPLALASELEAHLFHSLDVMLEAPWIDEETGGIAPVDLDERDLPPPLPEATPLSEAEKKLLNLLGRIIAHPDAAPELVLKGVPWEVEKVLDRIYAYFPEQMRRQLGWDSGFDGGKMQFSPFKVFGFDADAPVTGNPIILDLKSGRFHLGTFEDDPEILAPNTAFARWVEACLDTKMAWSHVDAMGELAFSLENDLPLPEGLPADAGFARANAELVKSYLGQGLTDEWSSAWKQLLIRENSPETCLHTLVHDYRASDLADMLERAILRQKIRPRGIPETPPTRIVAAGRPALKLLAGMWTSGTLEASAFAALDREARLDVLRVTAGSSLADDPEFVVQVLAQGDDLRNLLREDAVYARLERHFRARLWPQLKPLTNPLLNQLLSKEPPATFGGGEPDWLRVLENYLKTLGIPEHAIKEAANLRTQITPDRLTNYPFLQAALHPSGNVAARFGQDFKVRAACLRLLAIGLGHQPRALREFGFTKDEIADAVPDATGLKGAFRRLFGG